MNHISLFSGIGGFDLASEWIGWNNIASCEINPFGRKVLNHYWPDALHHDDVHTFTKKLLNEAFISKAPEKLVRAEMEKKEQAKQKLQKLVDKIDKLK